MVPEISLAHWLSRHHPEVSRGAGRTPGCETGGGKGVTQTMQRHARPRFPIKKKKSAMKAALRTTAPRIPRHRSRVALATLANLQPCQNWRKHCSLPPCEAVLARGNERKGPMGGATAKNAGACSARTSRNPKMPSLNTGALWTFT